MSTHTDDGALEAWTDGSADDTTHTVGYAVYWGRSHPLNYSRRITYETNTNNTAELNAVLHVLSVTPRDTDVKIYTDSQVTIHTLNSLKKHVNTPNSVHALTKKDSVNTARAKRALLEILSERQQCDATTGLKHVYSHLLDKESKMTKEERDRKLAEMRTNYGEHQYIRILQGNQHADELASNTIYGKREEQARHTHMKSQNTRFTANPATTAYDHVCRDHTHTDEKLSAYPMKRWHNDVKRHTTWDFV